LKMGSCERFAKAWAAVLPISASHIARITEVSQPRLSGVLTVCRAVPQVIRMIGWVESSLTYSSYDWVSQVQYKKPKYRKFFFPNFCIACIIFFKSQWPQKMKIQQMNFI
jgi:hypothetical protein